MSTPSEFEVGMLEIWLELWDFYGNLMLQYESSQLKLIQNPVKQGFGMTQTAYTQMADSIFDVLRSEAETSGLAAVIQQPNPQTKRPIVTVNGIVYDILSVENDDPTQPSIRMFVTKHQ